MCEAVFEDARCFVDAADFADWSVFMVLFVDGFRKGGFDVTEDVLVGFIFAVERDDILPGGCEDDRGKWESPVSKVMVEQALHEECVSTGRFAMD